MVSSTYSTMTTSVGVKINSSLLEIIWETKKINQRWLRSGLSSVLVVLERNRPKYLGSQAFSGTLNLEVCPTAINSVATPS